jgi:hypothetical protein
MLEEAEPTADGSGEDVFEEDGAAAEEPAGSSSSPTRIERIS